VRWHACAELSNIRSRPADFWPLPQQRAAITGLPPAPPEHLPGRACAAAARRLAEARAAASLPLLTQGPVGAQDWVCKVARLLLLEERAAEQAVCEFDRFNVEIETVGGLGESVSMHTALIPL
jgi:hypothetical protein